MKLQEFIQRSETDEAHLGAHPSSCSLGTDVTLQHHLCLGFKTAVHPEQLSNSVSKKKITVSTFSLLYS